MPGIDPPVPYQWSVADVGSAALLNSQIYNGLTFNQNRPLFAAWYGGTAPTIPNNTWTHMTLDTVIFDTEGGHSTTTNSQRYTCQRAGVYEVSGTIAFTAGGTGIRGAKFMINTSTSVPGSEQLVAPLASVATTVVATTSFARMSVGDYIEIFAYQNSGAGLTTTSNGTGDYACAMSCIWVSS